MRINPISRRAAVFSAGTAFLSLAMPTNTVGYIGIPTISKTYLLIHGAWHGGWCWEPVKKLIESRGYKVIAPTLTGLGSRADEMSALIGLQTHIDDVIHVIDKHELEDFVLVGHSYGGMVITGVADRMQERIRHLVYLDAALPMDGQSMISYGAKKTTAELSETTEQLSKMAPDGIAMTAFPPEVIGVPVSHPRYEWVKSQLTPHPLKTWLDRIRLDNDKKENPARSYIHCTDPVLPHSGFPFIAAQVKNDPEWDYHEIQTGHDAMVTAPDRLAEVLINV
ncbi:MAG: alpha/beta hydrolase [Parasphingorhabdus sp.]